MCFLQTLVQDKNPTHPPPFSTHNPFLWDLNTNRVMGPSGKIKKNKTGSFLMITGALRCLTLPMRAKMKPIIIQFFTYEWQRKGHKCWIRDCWLRISVWHSCSHLASLSSEDRKVTNWSTMALVSFPFRKA